MKKTPGRRHLDILKFYGFKRDEVWMVKEDLESITIMVQRTRELVHLRR
jgi:hypothetical protein